MRESEREAFSEFVAASSARLFRVAMALTGGHHAAEDLLQGALARTFARWRHVHGDPEAYVRRAMYRAQVSIWRQRRRHAEVSLDSVHERADQRDDIGATDHRLALRAALLRLGPRQRAVLVARVLEDLSEEETAALLGCSPGTVGSQLHRALARLRQIAPELDEHRLTEESLA